MAFWLTLFFATFLPCSNAAYPSWGGWLYSSETIMYDAFLSKPGCAVTLECGQLHESDEFSGGQLQVCQNSAGTDCEMIATAVPDIDQVLATDLWLDTDDPFRHPEYYAGCHMKSATTKTFDDVYTTSIKMQQDFFSNLPRGYDIKYGGLRIYLNQQPSVTDYVSVQIGNWNYTSGGCIPYASTQWMTSLMLPTAGWSGQEWYYNISTSQIIGQGNMLVFWTRGATTSARVSVPTRVEFVSEGVTVRVQGNSARSCCRTIFSLVLFITIALIAD